MRAESSFYWKPDVCDKNMASHTESMLVTNLQPASNAPIKLRQNLKNR